MENYAWQGAANTLASNPVNALDDIAANLGQLLDRVASAAHRSGSIVDRIFSPPTPINEASAKTNGQPQHYAGNIPTIADLVSRLHSTVNDLDDSLSRLDSL